MGQEHEAIQRDLIAALWPDLAEQIELEGSIATYSQASHRLQKWTGIRMPFCHRDWRALCEWAGLQPDKTTDDWLDEFLMPRLRVLWLKRIERNQTSGTIDTEAKTESKRAFDKTNPDEDRGSKKQPGNDSKTLGPLDYQYNGEWLTVTVCQDRFGLSSKSLSRWATQKCKYFEDRLLRRKKFAPDQKRWCYHRGDIVAICDARDSET